MTALVLPRGLIVTVARPVIHRACSSDRGHGWTIGDLGHGRIQSGLGFPRFQSLRWIYFVYSSAAAVKVKVQAWGNSLGLRIPKVFANALGVGSGSEMEVKVEDGALLARPAAAIHLEALLAEITAENQHSSTDWGDASGAEAW